MRTCESPTPATCRYHGWIDNTTYKQMNDHERERLERRMRLNILEHIYLAGYEPLDLVRACMPADWHTMPAGSLIIEFIPTPRLKEFAIKNNLMIPLGQTK